VVHQHLTCAEFDALPEARADLLVASFVRNPYDRVYSGFHQIQRDLLEQPKAAYSRAWVRDLVLKQLKENHTKLIDSGLNFDRWVAALSESEVFEVGRNTSFPLHPSHYWTHLDGRQYANFIGRVESFEESFSSFCKLLGIISLDKNNDNVSAREAEPLSTENFRYVGRMSRSSIQKINYLFQKDFEIFGYQMLK
jgi:hypothetical protein